MRGGPSRGSDVICMLHDTLRDTVAFPCILSYSPCFPPYLHCLSCCSTGVCSATKRAIVGVWRGWVGGGGG